MKYLFALFIVVLLVGCAPNELVVGGDKDTHGCIPSAGYSWCDAKQKCLRTWEENCTAAITNFAECAAAGNPIMESYPRQCSANGQSFTEIIEHVCTAEESQATACTLEYAPVCGKIILNTGDTIYQTFGNGCAACAAMKAVSYTPGECGEKESARRYYSTSVEECALLGVWNCEEGYSLFTDDTGCGCKRGAIDENNAGMPALGCDAMTDTEAFGIARNSACGDNFKCSCPEGYVLDGEACNPQCYYTIPQCGMPSIQCSEFLTCNEGTKTYWIDLTLEREGCNPACVIDVDAKTAEINWRCTGLIID